MIARFSQVDRATALVPVAALATVSGFAVGGYDSAAGKAVSYLVNTGLLVMLLFDRPPGAAQWRRAAGVLAATGAAFLWLLLVAAGPWSHPLAPDLVAAEALSFLAGVAALLAGWLIGLRGAAARPVVDWLIAWWCLLAAIALLLWLAGMSEPLAGLSLERDGRFQAMVGNVNVAAAGAGVTVMLAGGRLLALTRKTRGRRTTIAMIGYGAALAIALATLLATASRFGAAITLVLAVAIAVGQRRSLSTRQRIAIAVVAIIGAGVGLSASLLSRRLPALGDDLGVRLSMWRHYAAIAAQAPIAGFGPGSFPTINTAFLTSPILAERSWTASSAHDIVLQLVLTGGVPYLLCLLLAAGLVLRRILAGRGADRMGGTLEIKAALAIILAMGAIDIVLDAPATTTLALFLAGLLWGAASAGSPTSARPERIHIRDHGPGAD